MRFAGVVVPESLSQFRHRTVSRTSEGWVLATRRGIKVHVFRTRTALEGWWQAWLGHFRTCAPSTHGSGGATITRHGIAAAASNSQLLCTRSQRAVYSQRPHCTVCGRLAMACASLCYSCNNE